MTRAELEKQLNTCRSLTIRQWACAMLLGRARTLSNLRRHKRSDRKESNWLVDLYGALGELVLYKLNNRFFAINDNKHQHLSGQCVGYMGLICPFGGVVPASRPSFHIRTSRPGPASSCAGMRMAVPRETWTLQRQCASTRAAPMKSMQADLMRTPRVRCGRWRSKLAKEALSLTSESCCPKRQTISLMLKRTYGAPRHPMGITVQTKHTGPHHRGDLPE